MVIYYALALVAFVNAVTLLYTKYVKKERRAVRDRGAYTLFAVFMLVIAAGALTLGVLSE